jgi:hypothetical protein
MILRKIILFVFLKTITCQTQTSTPTNSADCYNLTSSVAFGSNGTFCFDFNLLELKEFSFYTQSFNKWLVNGFNSYITGVEYSFLNDTKNMINVNTTHMNKHQITLSNIEISGFKIGATSTMIDYFQFQIYDTISNTASFGSIIGTRSRFYRRSLTTEYYRVTTISGCFGEYNAEIVLKSIAFGYFHQTCINQTESLEMLTLEVETTTETTTETSTDIATQTSTTQTLIKTTAYIIPNQQWSEWKPWSVCILSKTRRLIVTNQIEVILINVSCSLICKFKLSIYNPKRF